MGQLVFQATAGGQVALVGPNPSSNFSLNVPAVNATLATTAGNTFTAQQVDQVDASISGLTVGKGGGSVSSNTGFGYFSLLNNTSGSSNTALGYIALAQNTTGSNNAAVGNNSLYANTTGSNNSAFGVTALTTNSTGSYNSAFGLGALAANTTASNNTAVGYQAAYSNTTGYNNTAVGNQVMYGNTTGYGNAAFGGNISGVTFATLQSNTTGTYNTAIGISALAQNTTATYNTAVGFQAGYSTTTQNYNTFVGYQAGYNFTGTSGQNCFIGATAGYSVTSGHGNTFIGTGDNGVFSSGYYVTTGSQNTILGNYNGNQGGLDIRTASNYIVLSDGSGAPRAYQSSTGGWYQYNNSTLWSITSDARIKKNVVSLESGLNVISALRPVEFDYIENDKHDIGFIAQEYQEILPAQVNEKEDGMLSLTPNLVPYLVKAIQELSAEVTALKAKLGA